MLELNDVELRADPQAHGYVK
ncbi:MAG: hypothetical protein RL684_1993, partial [Pseudomonadota bacterium]